MLDRGRSALLGVVCSDVEVNLVERQIQGCCWWCCLPAENARTLSPRVSDGDALNFGAGDFPLPSVVETSRP